jgi:hypothetical protein
MCNGSHDNLVSQWLGEHNTKLTTWIVEWQDIRERFAVLHRRIILLETRTGLLPIMRGNGTGLTPATWSARVDEPRLQGGMRVDPTEEP